MNNYCINLKKKKGQPFCNLFKKNIKLSDCMNCDKKVYKNSLKNKKTGTFLKKQTYKHKKADSNRFSIITNDLDHCIICGRKRNALHEVFYGSYRHISIKYGMIIPLCLNHHTGGLKSVHRDRELDLYFKRLAQDIFVKKYSYELFMKEFKKNYKKED